MGPPVHEVGPVGPHDCERRATQVPPFASAVPADLAAFEPDADETAHGPVLIGLTPAATLDAERVLQDFGDRSVVEGFRASYVVVLAFAEAVLASLGLALEVLLDRFLPGIALIAFVLFPGGCLV